MASREVSPTHSSGGDTIDDQPEDSKLSLRDPENEDLSDAPIPQATHTPLARGKRAPRGGRISTRGGRSKKGISSMWINETPADGTEDEGSVISARGNGKKAGSPDADTKTVGTTVGTRRQANGTVGSVYSGSKIRHIKKPDGTPLWRKEIQYEFLRLVVEDMTPVFTRISDGKKDCNFADIYIDCMSRSSKTSKVLKERLQVDREAAQNMAMICLLVNIGRMNTTLNFFPEMRAQLRTYHSIPVLQAYKSQKDYKSLQDAPRLKSILKGASEDTEEPRTLQAIQTAPVPRTNPVNLLFVLSQHAPKVSETHFTDKIDFFDLAMRSTISSATRARAFLWLMWWYLESDFSAEAALKNPFGPGQYREGQGSNGDEDIPSLVPPLTIITEEEGDAENVDTEEEKQFAEKMTKERKRVLEDPMPDATPSLDAENKALKRLKKGGANFGDDDSIISDPDSRASPGFGRSPAPDAVIHTTPGPVGTMQGGQAESLEEEWEAFDPHPGRGRYKRVRGKLGRASRGGRISEGGRSALKARTAGLDRDTPDTVDRTRGTPQPLVAGTNVLSQFRGRDADIASSTRGVKPEDPTAISLGTINTSNKPRARTGYQRELEERRLRRVEWALNKQRRERLSEARQVRESGRWLLRAARRIAELPATYDSDEDENFGKYGLGGVVGRKRIFGGDEENKPIDEKERELLAWESDDYGEEAETWSKTLKRAQRRLDIWEGDHDLQVYNTRVAVRRGKADRAELLRLLDRHPQQEVTETGTIRKKVPLSIEKIIQLRIERKNAPTALEASKLVEDTQMDDSTILATPKGRSRGGGRGRGRGLSRNSGVASGRKNGTIPAIPGSTLPAEYTKPNKKGAVARGGNKSTKPPAPADTENMSKEVLDEEIIADLLAERSDRGSVEPEDLEGEEGDDDAAEAEDEDERIGEGEDEDVEDEEDEEDEEGEDGDEDMDVEEYSRLEHDADIEDGEDGEGEGEGEGETTMTYADADGDTEMD